MSADTLVFIPAWNEEESLPEVLAEARRDLPDVDLLVVDDGSTDGSARVACAGESPRATSAPRTATTRSAAVSMPTASIPPRSLRACSRW